MYTRTGVKRRTDYYKSKSPRPIPGPTKASEIAIGVAVPVGAIALAATRLFAWRFLNSEDLLQPLPLLRTAIRISQPSLKISSSHTSHRRLSWRPKKGGNRSWRLSSDYMSYQAKIQYGNCPQEKRGVEFRSFQGQGADRSLKRC